MGAERWASCPCKGKLFGAQRIEPRHRAFALTALNEQDPHYMRVRLDDVPTDDVVQVIFTRGLLEAVTCPECKFPYEHSAGRYWCSNCWTKIIAQDVMEQRVLAELDKIIPDAIDWEDFMVWMDHHENQSATIVMFT
jgi:DNA-directed RNA polymerase subunit RPC12/RpoP